MARLLQTASLALGLAVALLTAATGLAEAKSFKLGAPVIATVTLPDKWNPIATDDGAEATSPDDEVYVSVEVAGVSEMEEAMKEAFAYLVGEGVVLDPKSQRQQQGKINGMDAVDLSYDGKDKNGDANKVSVSIIVVNQGQVLILTYWGSPEGEQMYGAELRAILNSIKRAA